MTEIEPRAGSLARLTSPVADVSNYEPLVGMADSVGPNNLAQARYVHAVALDGRLRAQVHGKWITAERLDRLDSDDTAADVRAAIRLRTRFHQLEEAYLEPDALARAWIQRDGDGTLSACVAADTHEGAQAWLDAIHVALPPLTDAQDEIRVPITFWALGPHGPVGHERRIDVSPWSLIAPNYSRDLTSGLVRILGSGFAPGVGGQLLVWHGPPGTGKTWALRSMAWEWRHWCDMHYITDPEVFFGGEAAYMLAVLLGQDYARVHGDSDDDDVEPDPRAVGGRWRCLILEDTGELLQADAKATTGQGLSRLLNVVDGLIGQGLRVLCLLTTNEQIRDLHPAVSRPGRCASHIEFASLPETEARLWLDAHEYDHQALGSGSRTIAELYELVDQHGIHRQAAHPVGFS